MFLLRVVNESGSVLNYIYDTKEECGDAAVIFSGADVSIEPVLNK